MVEICGSVSQVKCSIAADEFYSLYTQHLAKPTQAKANTGVGAQHFPIRPKCFLSKRVPRDDVRTGDRFDRRLLERQEYHAFERVRDKTTRPTVPWYI